MLPKGLLSRPLDYFFSNQDAYDQEAEHSVQEFFYGTTKKDLQEIFTMKMNILQAGILDEWLLFDFKLKNGNSLIQEYKENNFITDYEVKLYSDILNTNFYGFFEARSITINEGLVLCDLKTNQDYDVKEKSATHDLQKGNLFFTRLAMVDSNWEIVGANNIVIPTVKINKDFRKIYLEDKNPITPKMAFDLAASNSQPKAGEVLNIDSAKARINFEKELKKAGLDKFVSIDLVEKWLLETDDRFGNKINSLLFGLSAGNEIDDNLINTFTDFSNTTPKNSLRGKSSQEIIRKQRNWRPKLNMSITPIGGDKWRHELKKAHSFMAERNARKSIKHFENTFLLLEKEFTANPDIYRFYANAAISYFNYGERFLGKAMLAMALNLNTNYDFGQKVEKDYRQGKYEEIIDNGSWHRVADQLSKIKLFNKIKVKYKIEEEIINEIFDKVEEISKEDIKDIKKLEKILEKKNTKELFNLPSVYYYQFIRKLGINFKTDILTESKITTYSPDGTKVIPGRNDNCLCGSGKKYKKCCGKNW